MICEACKRLVLLVTGAAWGARRALYPGAEVLFLLALILPLLRHRDALRRSRAFSWRCLGEAGVWGALLVVLPSLAVALAVIDAVQKNNRQLLRTLCTSGMGSPLVQQRAELLCQTQASDQPASQNG